MSWLVTTRGLTGQAESITTFGLIYWEAAAALALAAIVGSRIVHKVLRRVAVNSAQRAYTTVLDTRTGASVQHVTAPYKVAHRIEAAGIRLMPWQGAGRYSVGVENTARSVQGNCTPRIIYVSSPA